MECSGEERRGLLWQREEGGAGGCRFIVACRSEAPGRLLRDPAGVYPVKTRDHFQAPSAQTHDHEERSYSWARDAADADTNTNAAVMLFIRVFNRKRSPG